MSRLKPTRISLMRGDDEVRLVRLQQRATSGCTQPFDLSRYQRFDLHAKDEETDEIVLKLSSDNGEISTREASAGELLLQFSHSLTEQAEWTRAIYDLQATDEDGKVKTLLLGTIELTHDITRGGAM